MKHADVQIGQTYLTRISGDLRRVKVLREKVEVRYGYRTTPRHGGSISRRLFVVQETKHGKILEKGRTAASLRRVPQAARTTVPTTAPSLFPKGSRVSFTSYIAPHPTLYATVKTVEREFARVLVDGKVNPIDVFLHRLNASA